MFSDDINNQTSSAKVQNSALVISLPDAKEATVWRFELNDLKKTSFSIKDDEGQYVLVKSDGKNTSEELGRYFQKQSALEALHVIQKALGSAKINGDSVTGCTWTPRCILLSCGKWLAVLAVVYAMVGYWMIPNALNGYLGDLDQALSGLYSLSEMDEDAIAQQLMQGSMAPAPQQNTQREPTKPAEMRPGEPIDVDALFSGQ